MVLCYIYLMKNITFTANENLIAQARGLAQMRGTTLNEEFRTWIEAYIASHADKERLTQARRLIDELTVPSGNLPTLRNEFNEREQRMLYRLDRDPQIDQGHR
jgi:hypothetical protein